MFFKKKKKKLSFHGEEMKEYNRANKSGPIQKKKKKNDGATKKRAKRGAT